MITNITEFEEWFSDYFEIDQSVLKACRYEDEDGDKGYHGLSNHGMSNISDTMVSLGITVCIAAQGSNYDPDKWKITND